jgi:hypothetical protein
MRNQITADYKNFWPNFTPSSFFEPLLDLIREDGRVSGAPVENSISFSSVYHGFPRQLIHRIHHKISGRPLPSPPRKGTLNASVWYTAENLRPPINSYDLTISFDIEDYGGTNVYFPYALLAIDWFNLGMQAENFHRLGRAVTPSELTRVRSTNTSSRPKFACAFVSNPEPVRMRAIEALRRYGAVDVYGKAGQHFSGGKYEIASQYRFMVCFENDLYPGYVTEKVVDCWASGCAPLWRGDDAASMLNEGAILNAKNFGSINDFAECVASIDQNPTLIDAMANQPLFKEEPTLSPIISGLKSVLRL